MKPKIIISLVVVVLVIAGVLFFLQHKTITNIDSPQIDFKEIDRYAQMASMVYNPPDEIKAAYGAQGVVVRELPKYQGQYFVVFDHGRKSQAVSVRGTNNIKNAVMDAEYHKSKDKEVGMMLHAGFAKSAEELYEDILPRLKKTTPLRSPAIPWAGPWPRF
ncbi:MAG: hypothetical protein GY849_22265 [Deltaproteobacteria bacterium]|nr:hypothetical protein [Deltaproteobacteria bacterium]